MRSTDGQCQVARNSSSPLASSVTVPLTPDMGQRPVKIEGLLVKVVDDATDEGTHKCIFEATVNSTNPIEYNGTSAFQELQVYDNDKVPIFSDSSVWPATPLKENSTVMSHRIYVRSDYGGIPLGEVRMTLDMSGPCSFYNYTYAKGGDSTIADLVGKSASKIFPAGTAIATAKFDYAVAVANDNVKNDDRTCTVTSRLTSADARVNTSPLNKAWTVSVVDDDTASTIPMSMPTARTATNSPATSNQAAATSQYPSTTTQQSQLTNADSLKTKSFLESIKVNGRSAESVKTTVFKITDKIVLSGISEPNVKLRLYIHSTPRTVDVTANAIGEWSYVIKNLEPGPHYVEAEATKVDGTKGSKATLATFSVAANSSSVDATKQEQSRSPQLLIVITIVGVAIAAAATFLFIRKNKLIKI